MSYTNLLEKWLAVLRRKTNDPEIQNILVEMEEALQAPPKTRIVLRLDGGLVQELYSEEPVECLKVEEPGDLDEDDLLEMYPEGSVLYRGETKVLADVFEAGCDPDFLHDQFERFEQGLQKKEAESGCSPGQ